MTDRRGDAEFADLFRSEYARLVRTARSITLDVQIAEELAQEAFLQLHRRWPRLRTYDKPGAWLRRVVIRDAVRERRRAIRGLRPEPGTAERGQLEPYGQVDDRLEVSAALAHLTPKQRAVIILYYHEDLEVAAVAELMGTRQGTVRAQLHQARQLLFNYLTKVEVSGAKG